MNAQPGLEQDAEHDPAAQEFLRQVYAHANTIYAVPQPEAWGINLDEGSPPRRFVRYKYQPLAHADEVRLIKLYHADASTVRFNGNALPQCEIFHVDLKTNPRYETISYAWGLLHETETIFINNDCCLETTKNLWSALDVLRHTSKPLVLWADQICIDQHDLAERQRQVALMQRIYSQARNTVIWLGQSDPTADAAFGFIGKIDKLNMDHETIWKIGVDIVRYSEDVVLPKHPELRSFINRERQGLQALSRLLRRSWFARMWCFQEVVVSKNLLYFCGMSCCSWKQLYKAVGLCYEEPLPPIGWSSTSEALKSRERHLLGQSDELLELLRRTSYCLCTDPRDKIYAVLNVQSQRNPINIPTDYSRTIRDVYIDTTMQIIIRTRSLAIFILRRENVKSDIPRLPTWVPDFAAVGAPFAVEASIRSSFCVSAHRPYVAHGPEIVGQLYVRGKAVDRVMGQVFDSLHTSLHNDEYAIDKLYPTMVEILRGRMGTGRTHSAGIDPVAEKLIRTLTADLGGNWDRKQRTTVDDIEISSIVDALKPLRSSRFVFNPWLQRFRSETRRCTSRSWLSLEKHTIALGPRSARPGDLVAIFDGSSVPLIIRPKGHYYELVGQSYIDGMMYGELCTWQNEQADTFFLI